MEKIKKGTRARAPEKKAEQFEKIIELGKDMFVKYGSHGFSLRALAKDLKMSQPNLYNYVTSKRELWIAIRTKYFKELYDRINNLINEHHGSYADLFNKLAESFLEFASEDYKRFQMMFLVSAPRSEKTGHLEENYKPFLILKRILDVVIKAIKEESLKNDKSTTNILYYFFGSLMGAAMTEANLKLRLKITEPIIGDYYQLSPEEYRRFVLNELRERLEREFFEKKKTS